MPVVFYKGEKIKDLNFFFKNELIRNQFREYFFFPFEYLEPIFSLSLGQSYANQFHTYALSTHML